MNLQYLLDAVINGSKTALIITAAGCCGLIIYGLAAGGEVVHLPYAFIAISLISVLMGGLRSGMNADSLGWLHGALVALVYAVLVFIAKAILFPASADISANTVFTAGLSIAGMVGGVTGVNLRFSRRSKVRRRYLGQ